jgi:hypothetical protein
LCSDRPIGARCDRCPQDKLDAAQTSETGLLLRRALDLRAAGIHEGREKLHGRYSERRRPGSSVVPGIHRPKYPTVLP